MAKIYNYINYENSQEAIKYYEEYFGAKSLKTVPVADDMAERMGVSGDLSKTTVHGEFEILGNVIMCSDSFNQDVSYGKSQSLMIDFNSEDEKDLIIIQNLYDKVTSHPDTKVLMELADQYWGGKMGMFVDKYGISWMLHAQPYSLLEK